VSQPALSEQLRKLESILGATLFERAPRRVEVTAHGEVLLRQARIVLREALGLMEIARAGSSPLDGPLRVGVIPTLGPYYLPLVLRALRAGFPGLELRLQEGLTHELAESLHRGTLDAILAALPIAGDAVTTEALFFEPFQLLVPAGHPLLSAGPVHPEDLPGEDLLLLEEGHCLRDQAISLCRLPGSGGRHARYASSLEMLRHMVAAGEGYTLMPRLAIGVMSGPGALDSLVQVRPLQPGQDGSAPGRVIALGWRATDPRGSHFSRLAHFLRDAAPQGTEHAVAIDAAARPGRTPG
jgi:LysR family transcriptional regulator, hydrogen peroxide-inducible genes activator